MAHGSWLMGAVVVVCASGLGAQTSSRGPGSPPAPSEWAGCVPGGDGVVEPVRRVLPASAELTLIEPIVGQVFRTKEGEQRLTAANLAQTPIMIDWVYATPAEGEPPGYYYFEASKRLMAEEGVLRVVVAGWLRSAGGSLTPAGTKSELQWEELDRPRAPEPAPGLLPLGTVRRDGERVWGMRRTATGSVLLYEVGAANAGRPLAQSAGC